MGEHPITKRDQVMEKRKEKSTKRPSLGDVKHPKKIAFLKSLEAEGGSITAAAKAAEIARSTVYNWIEKDRTFAELYDQQLEKSTKALEAEAIRRAMKGFEEPVFYQGKQVSTIRKYSDNLLMFLLKRRDPAYRDNFVQNVGIWGADGNVNVQFNIPRPDKGNKQDNPE